MAYRNRIWNVLVKSEQRKMVLYFSSIAEGKDQSFKIKISQDMSLQYFGLRRAARNKTGQIEHKFCIVTIRDEFIFTDHCHVCN